MSAKTLLIISHTEHFRQSDGSVAGWAPTVRELDELTKIFSKIVHIACLHPEAAPGGVIPYSSEKVEFIPIPPFGGKGWKKLSVFYTAPLIIWKVFKYLNRSTYFQFRAPTSMGIYLIPLLAIFSRKVGWFKYAGNWNHENPPLSYRFQRFFLKSMQRRIVTINGKWPIQPAHCRSFENPCLKNTDRELGLVSVKQKRYVPPFKICFIGRLEKEKGVGRILESLEKINDSKLIESVKFIGDGPQRSQFLAQAESTIIPTYFYGFQSQHEIFSILSESHFLLLPSDSEGFPKVVAEAANFGCIPIVSNVSSIPHYVNSTNGFLWNIESDFSELLKSTLLLEESVLQNISRNAYTLAAPFTFEAYRLKIVNQIIKDID